LQPEKKVVLVVTPNYFHDDTTKSYLGYYHTVPDAVEKLETFFLMDCFAFFKIKLGWNGNTYSVGCRSSFGFF